MTLPGLYLFKIVNFVKDRRDVKISYVFDVIRYFFVETQSLKSRISWIFSTRSAKSVVKNDLNSSTNN